MRLAESHHIAHQDFLENDQGSELDPRWRGDLDMSAAAFGFAVGTLYWGYFIFEVPTNLILKKVGARLWLARIMITWGAP